MLRGRLLNTNTFVRFASHESKKRFLRTIPVAGKTDSPEFARFNYQIQPELPSKSLMGRTWNKHSLTSDNDARGPRWAKHSLEKEPEVAVPTRRSRAARFRNSARGEKVKKDAAAEAPVKKEAAVKAPQEAQALLPTISIEQPTVSIEQPTISIEQPTVNVEQPAAKSEPVSAAAEKPKKARRPLRPRKALISLTPNAVTNLRALLDQPTPQLIRIGVRNRGCSGLTYHLEYVTEPGKFDETVEQDGVKVLIDSKALFLIVGSEMDWIDDKLLSRFIFRNPNSKGTCGCGESFMV